MAKTTEADDFDIDLFTVKIELLLSGGASVTVTGDTVPTGACDTGGGHFSEKIPGQRAGRNVCPGWPQDRVSPAVRGWYK